MQFVHSVLLAATLCAVLPSCLSPAQKTQYKAELQDIGADILSTTAVTAAQTTLDIAKQKLAEIQATPAPPGAGLEYALERGLALTTAQGLVNLAQRRLDAIKAKQAAPAAKQPVPDVNPPPLAFYRYRGRWRAESGLA